jgi:hypothetical protein
MAGSTGTEEAITAASGLAVGTAAVGMAVVGMAVVTARTESVEYLSAVFRRYSS